MSDIRREAFEAQEGVIALRYTGSQERWIDRSTFMKIHSIVSESGLLKPSQISALDSILEDINRAEVTLGKVKAYDYGILQEHMGSADVKGISVYGHDSVTLYYTNKDPEVSSTKFTSEEELVRYIGDLSRQLFGSELTKEIPIQELEIPQYKIVIRIPPHSSKPMLIIGKFDWIKISEDDQLGRE